EHTDAEGTLWAFTQCPDAAVIDSFELAGEPSEYELLGMDLQGRTDPERIHRTDVKLVHPVYNSPRLVAQDGGFTLHSSPRVPLDEVEACASAKLDMAVLYCWKIPAGAKPIVVEELSGLGITHRMVFPELDGIARSIWETEVLWKRRSD